jgi:glycerol uptake facilitator-like aquaporin
MPKFQLPSFKLSAFQAKFLVEGIGSFVLVLTIALAELQCGNTAINGRTRTRNLAPIAIGYMLTTLVFSFAFISGAHFNPAVTVGVMLVRAIRLELAIPYIVAQVAGAVAAAICALFLGGDITNLPAPHIFRNTPEFVIRGFIGEGVFSAVVVSVVLHVGCSTQKNLVSYAVAVGFCLMCCYYAVGGVSGGSFNPAVATGLQFIKCMTGNCIPLMHLWLYWAAPMAGALGASVLFRMVQPKQEVHRAPEAIPEAVY